MIHRWRMRPLMAAWLEESLTAAQQHRLRQHLEQCEECAAEARALEEADRLLRRARPFQTAPPPEVAQRVLRAALERSGALRRARRWRALGLCSLGGAAAACGLAGSLSPRPEASRVALEQPVHLTAPSEEPGAPASPAVPPVVPAADAMARAEPSVKASGDRRYQQPKPGSAAGGEAPLLALREEVPTEALPPVEPDWQEPFPDSRAAWEESLAPQPPMLLVVMVVPVPEPAPDEPEGFARAAAWEEVAPGEVIWKQATVPTPEADTELVLGSVPPWSPAEPAGPEPNATRPEEASTQDDSRNDEEDEDDD